MLEKDMNVLFSSKSDEWATPGWLFDKLNVIHDFTLDPASDGTNNKCVKHYTIKENGLVQSWKDERVFINPPYSKVYDWVRKGHDEAKTNDVTSILLVPARMDTRWFHEYCMDKEVCKSLTFIKGRLKFGDSKNSAPFPSMLIHFGERLLGANMNIPIHSMSNKR